MKNIEQLVRKNILALTPYRSARDEYFDTDKIMLDANENPYGENNRYPDPYQRTLKEAIATVKNTPVKNIFLGNGSDEIIDLIIRVFCNPGADNIIAFTPTYGMYKVSAAVNNINFIEIPLNKSFDIDENTISKALSIDAKIAFVCSPNNPTGNIIDEKLLKMFINDFNGIVVIDEAYIDFSDKTSCIKKLNQFENLIVLQTLSKAWGLAGCRIGMAFSNPKIISYLNKIKPPYNISSLNQKEALKQLAKMEDYKRLVQQIKTEKEKLITNLKKLSFIKNIYPSETNFLLIQTTVSASIIYNYLITLGIIVRNRSKEIPNGLRISIGKPEENNQLIKALKNFEYEKSIIY